MTSGRIVINCAKRELIEETGYSAGQWQKLGEITPVPGYSDEQIHIYLATDLQPAEQDLDKDEIINVHEIEFSEAMEMIQSGKNSGRQVHCRAVSGAGLFKRK